MTEWCYQPGVIVPGTVYRIIRHLATGGMGSVYDVEDTTVEKRYVLKTLHPELVTRDDLSERMRDEARFLAKLQHPNIVDVVTAGITADERPLPYYVMERLVGQTLRQALERTRQMTPKRACSIALDVSFALAHAHDHALVHSDVKPENIFLHRLHSGQIMTKLLDFGIARWVGRIPENPNGKFMGTLRYAAPEQVKGSSVGPPADVYSLGLVLFEMLAGRGPFDDAGDAWAVGRARLGDITPRVSRFCDVAPELDDLIACALAREPNHRPKDGAQFASALRKATGIEPPDWMNSTTTSVPTSPVVPSAFASTTPGHTTERLPEVSGEAPTRLSMSPPASVQSAQTVGRALRLMVVAGAVATVGLCGYGASVWSRASRSADAPVRSTSPEPALVTEPSALPVSVVPPRAESAATAPAATSAPDAGASSPKRPRRPSRPKPPDDIPREL